MWALWSNAQDGGAWAEALLSPLFGEFLRSVPESNVIYGHRQVPSDDDQHQILTKFQKKNVTERNDPDIPLREQVQNLSYF